MGDCRFYWDEMDCYCQVHGVCEHEAALCTHAATELEQLVEKAEARLADVKAHHIYCRLCDPANNHLKDRLAQAEAREVVLREAIKRAIRGNDFFFGKTDLRSALSHVQGEEGE